MSLDRQDGSQKKELESAAKPALQGLQLPSSSNPVEVGGMQDPWGVKW